ncbi:MAG: hypothetical protein F4077_08170 [Gammaproteobacteria bacterium]|nr:hypothetical protein [Gammaproteobacteria bacterium]
MDHLGVQAPGINIYGRLLPGITNVTDRARYYSFYPWLIWSFDRHGFRKYDDEFKERLRRADCLFTLIALRHAHVTGTDYEDHAEAMVGSNTLARVVRELKLNETLTLSDYSLREGAKTRYFKNPLGGLGQYYLGVLRELKMLDGDTSGVLKYTTQIGKVIAEYMNMGFDGDLFLNLVESDKISSQQLDDLSSACPCQLRNNRREAEFLVDLFFARDLFYDPEALSRRHSLQSILHLSSLLAEDGDEISEFNFRACAYSDSLPNNQDWPILDSLAQIRAKWAVYARHELLSVATQGLFYALLDGYEASVERFHDSVQLVEWFSALHETQDALDAIGTNTRFSSIIEIAGNELPPLTNWSDPNHEIQHAERLVRLCRSEKSAENRREVVVAALRVLIALAQRFSAEDRAYGDLVFEDGYFSYYPLNLQSFQYHVVNTWSSLTARQVLNWLLQYWCIENHMRVALRKLRTQSQSTFRIRPADRGFEVTEIPPAVHTRPRFNQAVRILKDLGILEREDSGLWVPSSLGISLLELGDAF